MKSHLFTRFKIQFYLTKNNALFVYCFTVLWTSHHEIYQILQILVSRINLRSAFFVNTIYVRTLEFTTKLVFSCSNVEVYYAQFCHTLGNIFHHCPCKTPPCFSINSFTNTCRTPMISSKNITTFYHDLFSSHCICRCTLWPFFLWVSLVTCIFPQFCSCQQDVVWHLFPLLLPLDTVIWS